MLSHGYSMYMSGVIIQKYKRIQPRNMFTSGFCVGTFHLMPFRLICLWLILLQLQVDIRWPLTHNSPLRQRCIYTVRYIYTKNGYSIRRWFDHVGGWGLEGGEGGVGNPSMYHAPRAQESLVYMTWKRQRGQKGQWRYCELFTCHFRQISVLWTGKQ